MLCVFSFFLCSVFSFEQSGNGIDFISMTEIFPSMV